MSIWEFRRLLYVHVLWVYMSLPSLNWESIDSLIVRMRWKCSHVSEKTTLIHAVYLINPLLALMEIKWPIKPHSCLFWIISEKTNVNDELGSYKKKKVLYGCRVASKPLTNVHHFYLKFFLKDKESLSRVRPIDCRKQPVNFVPLHAAFVPQYELRLSAKNSYTQLLVLIIE